MTTRQSDYSIGLPDSSLTLSWIDLILVTVTTCNLVNCHLVKYTVPGVISYLHANCHHLIRSL